MTTPTKATTVAATTTPPVEKIEGRPLWSVEDHFYLAATIWAEARGEGDTGMRVVGHVIRNRVNANKPKNFGTGYKGVTLKDWQFSCWNKNAPGVENLNRKYLNTKLTGKDAKTWLRAQAIATEILNGSQDLTGGADHYHTLAVNPVWNRTVNERTGKTLLVKTVTVGAHVFYKPR